jgi:hypothetical protein
MAFGNLSSLMLAPRLSRRLIKSSLLAAAPVAALLLTPSSAQAIGAITAIDNIGSTPFPAIDSNVRTITSGNWIVQSFRTPVSSPSYAITSLRLALGVNGVTAINNGINVNLYLATNTGLPSVSSAPSAFKPTGASLASAPSYFSAFNNTGNLGSGGGYTLLDSSLLGSISTYTLSPNTAYSIVISGTSGAGLGVFSMGTGYTESLGFDFLNNTGTSSGTVLSPIAITSSWNNPTQGNVATFGMTIGVDVPGPIPFLGVAAAFGCSRQLRRRIRQEA